MARVPPSILARFGRGFRSTATAIRPAVPFALGTGAVALGAGFVVNQATGFRKAANPPLQVEGLDTNPATPGNETQVTFDPRTGRTLVFGTTPTDTVGPERSQERTAQTGILVAGIVAAVALIAFVGRGK